MQLNGTAVTVGGSLGNGEYFLTENTQRDRACMSQAHKRRKSEGAIHTLYMPVTTAILWLVLV